MPDFAFRDNDAPNGPVTSDPGEQTKSSQPAPGVQQGLMNKPQGQMSNARPFGPTGRESIGPDGKVHGF